MADETVNGGERGPQTPPAVRSTRRRLIVPVVLAVTVAGAIVGLASSASGCGDDGPTTDASVGDARPDTPIV